MSALLALPLLPLAGFLVNGLLGRRLPERVVGAIACALPAAAFALTLVLVARLVEGGSALTAVAYTWAATGAFQVDVALYFDAVAATMCLIVTGIGTLIHVYSLGYMRGDPGFARYFAYLNLFLCFMLILVLGDNLVVLFVGWEGVGLASYLLIGFWFEDPAKTAAGLKAFVTNRVGDAAFLVAGFLTWNAVGALDFATVNAYFEATSGAAPAATAIGVLLLLGACGKSAQIPLHVWLPDAMAGPTPVSALIHAATMVTAGVYLLARLHVVYAAAPDAQLVVTWIGATTALAGAALACGQYNLKKVLAYSTMSQLGLMVLACGLGGWSVAMFHLYAHAFFKACLFLGAGAVLHALHGEEDMRRMGGLARRLPSTFVAFLFGALALCALPPFAGFFSKDEILWLAWSAPAGSPLLWGIGTATSLLTAFYMFRALFLTFGGTAAAGGPASAPLHAPSTSMLVPLAVLAFGALAAGAIGIPEAWRESAHLPAPFFEFVEPVLGRAPVSSAVAGDPGTFAAIAVIVSLAGIAVAWLRYGRRTIAFARTPPAQADEPRTAIDPLDAFYARVAVPGVDRVAATLARRAERLLSRTALDAVGRLGSFAGRTATRLQSGDLQTYLLYALAGLALVVIWGAVHG